MKPIPTKPSSRTEALFFLQKAEEFAKTMEKSYRDNEYNSTAVLAIHCTISSCDAVTSFFLEKRSTNPTHLAVLDLLNLIQKFDKDKERQIISVLSIKNAAEYQSRMINESEARRMFIQSRRILEWTRSIVMRKK